MDDKPRHYVKVYFADGDYQIVGLNREATKVEVVRMAPKNDGTDQDQEAVVASWNKKE